MVCIPGGSTLPAVSGCIAFNQERQIDLVAGCIIQVLHLVQDHKLKPGLPLGGFKRRNPVSYIRCDLDPCYHGFSI